MPVSEAESLYQVPVLKTELLAWVELMELKNKASIILATIVLFMLV